MRLVSFGSKVLFINIPNPKRNFKEKRQAFLSGLLYLPFFFLFQMVKTAIIQPDLHISN